MLIARTKEADMSALPETHYTLGDALRDRRGANTLAAAAKGLGVSRQMYKQWEDDYAHPGNDKVQAIAAWTGLSRYRVYALMDILTDQEADVLESAMGGYHFQPRLVA